MKKLMPLLLALMSVLLFTACSSDDDETPALSFDVNTITGTWEIKEVGENPYWSWINPGSTLVFNSNGTCETDFYMEDSYKVDKGQVKTYCKSNDEPMFVYTLIAKDGDVFTVRINGTLDEGHQSITIKMKKKSR